jgi:protein-tyrosine phosphatase
MSGWSSERSRHGGVDRIPLPDGTRGELHLCGKHFIGPDVHAALERTGATRVVCLNEPHELEDRYPEYVQWLRTDPRAIWHPVPDLHAPGPDEAAQLVATLRRHLDDGEGLLVRAGTIAAAILLDLGHTLDEARRTVAAARPMAGPEAGAQEDLLDELAARHRTS